MPKFLQPTLLLALTTVVVAVVFAAYTEHVWEDYYITFRSSQNLVEGNGLVFNVGERVHTFTSPLGVLLPALASLLTGTESDLAALWLFRAMSILALAGAVVLLVLIAKRWGIPAPLALVAGLWLALDGKTLDFSINGMETAFLVLFLIYALWAHLGGSANWKHQGAAWAGMMWTRPDCFIYIALLALAVLLFGIGDPREARSVLIRSWLKAALITTALYLPWFLWAWVYYGTPVPHTVVAKSGMGDPFSILNTLWVLVKLPFATGFDNSMGLTFLPAYVEMGGWDDTVILMGRILSGVIGLAWLLPKVSRRTRLLSFVFGGIHLYLTTFPYYCFPWYLPASIPFGILTGISLLGDFWKPEGGEDTRANRLVLMGTAGLIVFGSSMMTLQIARQMRDQQQLVETSGRRLIGEYLQAHAKPTDTVFMEPLGYIGYFSGLRTYDFPGMSSPEMVAARKMVGKNGHMLIGFLRPDWIAIRPSGLDHLTQSQEWRIEHAYELAQVFDQTEAIEASPVAGIGYLLLDSTFLLFRRNSSQVSSGQDWRALSDFGIDEYDDAGERWLNTHAEAELFFPVPEHANSVTLTFGFHGGVDQEPRPTDGVRFGFEIRDRPRVDPLGYVIVSPPRDPLVQSVTYEIPSGLSRTAELRIVLDRVIWKDQDRAKLKFPEFGFPL